MLKTILYVHEAAAGPRLDLAVEQLATGLGFVFEGVWFRKDGEKLQIEAVAHRAVSERDASELLRVAESALQRLKAVDVRFAAMITRLEPHYSVIDDYGMGSVVLWRRVGDGLERP